MLVREKFGDKLPCTIQKHSENYNRFLNSEESKKRRADHFTLVFDEIEAGSLKKQKFAEA